MTRASRPTARRRTVLARAALRGAAGGLVGATAVGQGAERAVTGRPASHVSGRTLLVLVGRPAAEGSKPVLATAAAQVATSAGLGALRGVWRATGLVRRRADVAQTLTRVLVQQTLENAAGEGAPARTWRDVEAVAEVLHAAVGAVVTGLVVERWVDPVLESRAGTSAR